MAEAIAGFYAVETVVEGAAIAGIAASRPTVPLHAQFKKLSLPKDSPTTTTTFKPTLYHSFNIVKGKGYIFGGDTKDGSQDSCMKVVTLPSSLENGEVDFQIVEAITASERPLKPYSESAQSMKEEEKSGFEKVDVFESADIGRGNQVPEPRAAHAATTIDSNVFIIGGRSPRALDTKSSVEEPVSSASSSPSSLFNCDVVHCFSTQTNNWTTLHADISRCKDGIPSPRTGASCASTPSPQSIENVDMTVYPHGTIFLHGGYDAQDTSLRDTWAFSVSTQIWSKWPDLPSPSEMEVPGEGRIIVRGATINRVGDGFGKVSYLDFETVQEGQDTSSSSSSSSSLKPKTPQWQNKTTTSDLISSATAAQVPSKLLPQSKPQSQSLSLPMPRHSAHYLPVTTGSGRFYNIYLFGQDGPENVNILNDIWSYQVTPETSSLASIKDAIRNMVGKGTGDGEWARCEVVESSMKDGPVDAEIPTKGGTGSGLTGYGADVWRDQGGGVVVLWGGRRGDGVVVENGWIVTFE